MSRTRIRVQVHPTGSVVRTAGTQVKANLALLLADRGAKIQNADLRATRP